MPDRHDLPNVWLYLWYFYHFLFHFFRCFHGKVQNIMREFLTIRHSGDLFWFRQLVENRSIPIFSQIKSQNHSQIHQKTSVHYRWLIKYKITWKCHQLIPKTMSNFKQFYKYGFEFCLKIIESFHCNLNMEFLLVLWCATSEVNLEARFWICIKFCIK